MIHARNRNRLLFIIGLFTLVFMSGCVYEEGASQDLPGIPKEAGSDDLVDDDDDGSLEPIFCEVDEGRVEEILSEMPLEKKIAQMYYVGVDVFPWFPSEDVTRKIQQIGVGAVHAKVFLTIGPLNSWTVKNTNKLQAMAMENAPAIPLLIGIDQEGGAPQSLSTTLGGTDTPGNMGLGATFDPDATEASYDLMASQLYEVGINLALAPVLEVMTSRKETSMYTRCFGEDPDQVAAHARAAVRGTQGRLIMATAKHFPGQTAAPGDEHSQMPISWADETVLRQVYLKPFAAAVDAGVEMIMPTHARFAAWDPELPATLSPAILGDLLRDEMGFDGIIISDDMNMWGMAGKDWGEMPDLLAIRAGVDMIMDIFEEFEPADKEKAGGYPTDLEGQIAYLAQAVSDGRLSEDRIDQSVRRILSAKMKYCLFENSSRQVMGVGSRVDTTRQRELSADLHERAITLVRNEGEVWPLPADPSPRYHVIAPGPLVWEMYPGAQWPNFCTKSLLKAVKELDPRTTGVFYSSPLYRATADFILAGVLNSDADAIVIGTYNALDDAVQAELVQRILDLGRPTIIFALAMPYDLLAFPQAPVYFAVYSNHDLAVEAAARVLLGRASPGGRLPVSIPGLYEMGWSAAK